MGLFLNLIIILVSKIYVTKKKKIYVTTKKTFNPYNFTTKIRIHENVFRLKISYYQSSLI